MLSQLNIRPEGATYWLDGIPKSDDQELKELTLKGLLYAQGDEYPAAIEEFENILRVCTVSPTQRMSILLNLAVCYPCARIYTENGIANIPKSI